ncbi:uncharacterized protein LOC124849085 [Vigna umbellata]|uniref:uncharacterized protein LOC124849085 n=1 Tax=Vigna umbellata TaxID=87088 RepID=UPI001F5F8EC7|nr:uncharacterized protein LOC124849085 [Vigna umbellata]
MKNSCSSYEKMGYSNAPRAYYSTLHDSITSLCKTILPLGLKKKCLVSAEHTLWKLQSDNLKWQQDSLHQILNLMALHKDDILSEDEVSAFRAHLLDTLLASPPPEQDHASIIKDKLMFLQELLHAKCISEGECQSSRRPLLVRLAVQGGEIEGREVISAGLTDTRENPEEEWSDIDLKDDQCLMNKENSNSKKTSKQPRKQVMKGATSVLSFGSPFKPGKNSMEKSIFNSPTLHMHSTQSKVSSPSIFTQSELRHPKENKPFGDGSEKMKRKPFRALFHRDKNKKEGHGGGAKNQWGFDGLRKGKKSDTDDDTVPLSLNERSDSEAYFYQHFSRAHDEVSLINKLQPDQSPSVFSVDDKVLVEDYVKKELSRMPTEMRSADTNLNFSPRFDRQSEEEVKKQLKNSVVEMENRHNNAEVKHENSMGWTTFEDEENLHPNLFVHHGKSLQSLSNNPFLLHG